MEYRLLGKSALNISEIGFGCMSLDPADPASEQILQEALNMGINFFDTADLYHKGLNEEMVGRAFRGMREKVIIASKAGNQWRPDGSGWDWNPSKKYILQMADRSLGRLKMDYIDLYQLHGGTINDPIDETIEAFELLKAQGKIRYYGISSIRPNVIREYVHRSAIVSVMMQYSLLDRRPEESMLDLLHKNQVGVLARGTVASGLLLSKLATPYLNYSAGQVKLAADAVREMSDEKRTAEQTALRFVLQQSAVTSAIVGIRTRKHLQGAVAAVQSKRLNQHELENLSETLPVNRYQDHR